MVTEGVKEVRRKIFEQCPSAVSSCLDDTDLHDRRREFYESPEQKLKVTIIKLGEVVSV